MEKQAIIEKLQQLLVDTNPAFKDIPLHMLCTSSLAELGLDSIGTLTFMVSIEDALGVEWDEDKALQETLKNFNTIAEFILTEYASIK